MTHSQRTTPRGEHLQHEKERTLASPFLSEKYTKLKSLTVDLSFFNPEGTAKSSQIKYAVNLDHSKSVFRFGCQNHECVRGDYDLSHILTSAVNARKKSVEGELCCQGWRNRSAIDTEHCHNLLRYKLAIAYKTR